MNKNQSTIKLTQHQRIDLGGLGKGFAIDLAFEKLKPLKNFVINAGGDIRTFGKNRNAGDWLVSLKNTSSTGTLGVIKLKNKALCCSGSWARKIKFFHHLINPRNGLPQNEIKTVFVMSNDASDADAWATSLFASGDKSFLYAKKYNLSVLIVNKDGKILKNKFPEIKRLEN